MILNKGDKAPFFKLYNSNKKEISTDTFNGKTFVIHFFPLAFTGTCTKQLCTLRDDFSFYSDLNVDVVSISVDSLFVLNRFKDEQNLTFDLLSDFNKETSLAYGALYNEFLYGMKGVSKRAAFVIDKNGIIQYAEVLESASDLPNFEAIKELLKVI